MEAVQYSNDLIANRLCRLFMARLLDVMAVQARGSSLPVHHVVCSGKLVYFWLSISSVVAVAQVQSNAVLNNFIAVSPVLLFSSLLLSSIY